MGQSETNPQDPDATGHKVRGSTIVGATVVNSVFTELGDIEDVVIDSATGRIAIAVLWCGNMLGMFGKLVAIPFAALRYSPERDVYVLNEPAERLRQAPGFDPQDWPRELTGA